MEKITILITDDQALVREAWSFILGSNPKFQVVAECSSGEEAIKKSIELRPNIVIMDINLPGMKGIEATEQIRKYSPASKIIGVSMHSEPAYVSKIMNAGALGYVTKNSHPEEMFKAISEVAADRKYICDEIKNNLSELFLSDVESKKDKPLSVREMEIVEYIKKGDSSKEIAAKLDLSVKTVEVHRYNILKKLDLKNSASLVNFMNSTQF